MKITPLDVGNHRFPKRFRGYDRREVDIFLEMISQEMEELIQENQYLAEEMKKRTQQLNELKEKEQLLQESMLTAQKMSDDMKNNMLKEAQVVVAQAELEAEQIINKGRERLVRIQDDIMDLKAERTRLREELRSVIRTYGSLLEAGEERDKEEDEDGIESTLRVMPTISNK